MSPQRVTPILQELKQRLSEIYGSRLVSVLLFGSYARGDAKPDSDLDLAIILDSPRDHLTEWDASADLLTEIGIANDILFNTFFIDRRDYENGTFALHRAIRREGIAI